MLRIEKSDQRLVRLDKANLELTELPAAPAVRQLVLASAREVVSDLDANLFLLDSDVQVGEGEAARADLLCAQQDGTITVLLFPKTGIQQLSLALTISGGLARWSQENFIKRLSEDQRLRLSEFLSGSLDRLNHRQELLLVLREGDADLVTAVDWLRGSGVGISLLQLVALKDSRTDASYLTLSKAGVQSDSVSIVREAVSRRGETDVGPGLAALTGRLEEEERGRYLLEQRYRTVSRLAPIGIFHTDARGDYLFVNQRWSEITGLSQQEAAKQGWTAALYPDDRGRVLAAWSETLRSNKAFKAEFRFLRADGISWVIAEADLQIDLSGAVIGAAGTVTELHRSRLEDRDKRNESSPKEPSKPDNSLR